MRHIRKKHVMDWTAVWIQIEHIEHVQNFSLDPTCFEDNDVHEQHSNVLHSPNHHVQDS